MKNLLAIIFCAVFSTISAQEMTDYEKYKLEKERIEHPQEEEVFYVVESMPKFNGKEASEFKSWIAMNVKYPSEAVNKKIEGKVFVSFIVNSDGNVVDVKVEKGVDPYLDAEVVRVVKSSPKWIPGSQRGKKVNVQFTFPVNFVLQKEETSDVIINNYYVDEYPDYSRMIGLSWGYYDPFYSYSPYWNWYSWNPWYYDYWSYNSWYWDYNRYRIHSNIYYPTYGYYHRLGPNYYNYGYYRNTSQRVKSYQAGVIPKKPNTDQRYRSRPPVTYKSSDFNSTRINRSTSTVRPYTRTIQTPVRINSQRSSSSTQSYTIPQRSSNTYNRPVRSSTPSRSYSSPTRSSSSYSRSSSPSVSSSRSYSSPTRSGSSYSGGSSSSSRSSSGMGTRSSSSRK